MREMISVRQEVGNEMIKEFSRFVVKSRKDKTRN